MKKLFFLTACFVASAMLLSACQVETNKSSMVNAKRRLEQYIPATEGGKAKTSSYVDLSEGPKLKYNADFGPRDLNFDVKVVNPY